MRSAVLALAAALLAACAKSQPAAPDAGTAAAGAVAPVSASAYVNAVAALRREPTEASRVPGPSGKDVSNFLVTLHRGEKVTLLETKDDWAKVRASDDRDGWMKRTSLLEGDGITEATVLAPADVFDRPDLLAANAKRKVEPGTLVLVVKARPPFTEVNVAGAQNAWILSERLATGDREVSVAKLVEKARWLVKAGKPDDALQILALAREHFAGVVLVDALATELGEAQAAVVPAGGVVPPADGTAPAPPATNDAAIRN
jgi:SH3-like domain-containing protein